MSYRTEEETRYFGSDLNKWINENCSKEMTANNIDLLMFKRSKNSLRIIESKHKNENMPRSQFEALKILAKIIKPLIDKTKLIKFGVYIVRGDYPYHESVITDLSTGLEIIVDDRELKSWLEFKSELAEIQEAQY